MTQRGLLLAACLKQRAERLGTERGGGAPLQRYAAHKA